VKRSTPKLSCRFPSWFLTQKEGLVEVLGATQTFAFQHQKFPLGRTVLGLASLGDAAV